MKRKAKPQAGKPTDAAAAKADKAAEKARKPSVTGGLGLGFFICTTSLVPLLCAVGAAIWGLRRGEKTTGAAPKPGNGSSFAEQLSAELGVQNWTMLSASPRIYVFEHFLSDEECEYLKKLAEGRLKPAMVVQDSKNKYDTQVTVRNNRQLWLTYEEEQEELPLRALLKRIHRAARIPDDDSEALQIGHYGVGEKYEQHQDSDPPRDIPRPATMIVYLNDVLAGGETMFPKIGHASSNCRSQSDSGELSHLSNCCLSEEHVKVPAKKGRAVLFFNHDLQGHLDSGAEHAACPIREGEKWIIQRWFRFEPYQRIVHPPDLLVDGLPGDSAKALAPWDLRVLSQKPRVYIIEDFLSSQEIEHLLSFAGDGQPDAFTEHGVTRRWLPAELHGSDVMVSSIIRRLHLSALVPEGYAEPLQLGWYKAGSEGTLHTDTNPTRGAPRPMTAILYLTEDGVGSHDGTVFPRSSNCSVIAECCRLGAAQSPINIEAGKPLLVPAKRGRLLLFASHTLKGEIDPLSLHGGCPVGEGGKTIAQLWFRDSPVGQ